MLLQAFFDQLTYGELAQISIGGIEQEGVVDEVYPNVVSQINLGLLAIAKRFPIRMSAIEVQEKDTINLYRLNSTYSVLTGIEPDNYIIDTVSDTFTDDVLKLEYITYQDSDDNTQEIPFNVLNDVNSIIKRDYNSFYITAPEGRLLTVYYRAKLTELDLNVLDPDTDIIDIPPIFIEPLLYFVAARLHANRPTIDGQENTGLKYLQLYEKSLLEIDNEGLLEEANFVNHKIYDNGWV